MRKYILPFGFGFLVLLLIVWGIGFEEIIDLLFRIRPIYFILAAIVYFSHEVIASLALKIALSNSVRDGAIKPKLRDVLSSHLCGMLYGQVTPGTLGYYYTAVSLSKKTDTSISGNVGVITAVNGIYLSMKIITTLIATLYFSSIVSDIHVRYLFLSVSIIPVSIVILMILTLYTNLPHRILGKFGPVKRVLGHITSMQDACRKMSRKNAVEITAIGLLGWLLQSSQWFLLVYALNLDVDFLTVLMLRPLLTAIAFLPITPGGIGFAEGGSAVIFNLIGLALADGFAFMLLVRINSLLVDSIGIIDMKTIAGRYNTRELNRGVEDNTRERGEGD